MRYDKEGVTGRKRSEHSSIRALRTDHRIGNVLLTDNETAAIVEALTSLDAGLSSIPFPVDVVVALVPAESDLGLQTTGDRSPVRQMAT